MPGGGLCLTRPTHPALTVCRPAQAQRRRARTAGTEPILAGWRLRLTRPTFVRPVVNLFTFLAETAGADGLKIAETFPAGRGSPHGCGLRAVFCRDAASARPEACRDKSKGPRSGDFAGRSPGVQGEAATGLPLCAPCAMKGITQKKYRERNLPGNNIEQTLFPGRNRCTPRTVSTKPQFVRRVRRSRHPAFYCFASRNCTALSGKSVNKPSTPAW